MVAMKRRQLLHLLATIPAFLVLLFGVGAGHALLTSSAMSVMGEQMPQSQCQSSCISQTNVAAPERKIEVADKDIEPQPAEPYYLAFMGVGWSIVIIVAGFLLWHLRWRPPDLYKLNSVYRF